MPVDVRPRFKIDETLIDRAQAVLRPADLILFFAEPPASSAVFHAQLAYGFPEAVCAITHVGLYIGGGQIVHAQPVAPLQKRGGIRAESLAEVLDGRTVACLRYQGFTDIVSVSGPDRTLSYSPKSAAAKVVASANAAVGGRYDYRAVVNLAIDALRHKFDLPKRRPRAVKRFLEEVYRASDPGGLAANPAHAFICSDLVYDCYDSALPVRNPMNRPELMRAPNRLPVEFFLNPHFLSVNLAEGGPETLTASFGPLNFGSGGGGSGPVVRLF